MSGIDEKPITEEERLKTEINNLLKNNLERKRNFGQSSYCGPNCRHCNRFPSYIRRLRWKIEDMLHIGPITVTINWKGLIGD